MVVVFVITHKNVTKSRPLTSTRHLTVHLSQA